MKFIGFKTNSGGIYVIRNKVNGQVYVGRTSNFKKRYYQYTYDFKNTSRRTINEYLSRSYAKYGGESFEFEPIWYCFTEAESIVLEVDYMNQYNSLKQDFGYNLRCDSEGGMTVSKRTSDKISARLKKEWASGIRNQHSEKLKRSWDQRDRVLQSDLFSKSLTKWVYYLEGGEEQLLYKDLCNLGLKNVVASFHKKNTDSLIFKGIRITRRRLVSKNM